MNNENVPDAESVEVNESVEVDDAVVAAEEPGTTEAGGVGESLPGGESEAEGEMPAEEAAPEEPSLEQQLAERTEDLQRLQAEYVNYKRRVDRDRDQARRHGIESVMVDLLPTLDAIAMARQAGELVGGPKLIADELEKLSAKHGLVSYGESGDVFDPQMHDALMAMPGAEGQTEALCADVLQQGWRLGDRIIRHARVAVSEPTA